jgi:transposase
VHSPPERRERRASRKPELYLWLWRWYEPAWGPDPDERAFLRRLGYGRWVDRDRLTAEMTAALLIRKLGELESDATDIASNRADELSRMTQALMRRRVRGLTDNERRCLDDLQRLERKTRSHLEHVADDGTRIYAPDPPQIEKAWQRIKRRYPEIIASLVHQTTEEIYSTKSIRLGRRQSPIFLGERARLLDEAARLRAELGERFLSPTATSSYRAASVRKWWQLAQRREQERPD